MSRDLGPPRHRPGTRPQEEGVQTPHRPGTRPYEEGHVGGPTPEQVKLWNDTILWNETIRKNNEAAWYAAASRAPTGSGGGTPPPGSPAAAAPTDFGAAAANPPMDENLIRQRYPQLAWLMDDPEIRWILTQAANEGWDSNRLQGALYTTHWWQGHSATMRQWQQLVHQDNASAAQRIRQQATAIDNTAKQWGISLDQNQLFAISTNYLQYGWDDAMLHRELGKQLRQQVRDPRRTLGGQARARVDAYKALGSEYLLPVTDHQAAEWAIKEFEGTMTEDGVRAMYTKQAKARFGYLSDELDRGITVAEYFEPVRQQVAQLMETTPEEINLMDNRWRNVTDYVDPTSGKTRGMTLTEAANYARRQPEWARTDNAREQGAQIANRVLETFGQVKR